MKKQGKAVLVTTKFKGVFFGYLEKHKGGEVTLTSARNCVRWSGIKGFLALADSGPSETCQIGPAVSRLKLLGVTSIADVAREAVEAWERAPW